MMLSEGEHTLYLYLTEVQPGSGCFLGKVESGLGAEADPKTVLLQPGGKNVRHP